MSNNTKEFGVAEVQDGLLQAGITKYFSRTEDFLGWLQSQSELHAGGKLKNYEKFYDATFKTALAGDFTGGNCHYNSVFVHSSPIELSKQTHRSHPQRPGYL